MSILIKGVKIPKDDEGALLVFIKPDGKGEYMYTKRFYWKELKPVELSPHGRLIDADALEEESCDLVEPIAWWNYRFGYSRDKIKNAPTIIEAEE